MLEDISGVLISIPLVATGATTVVAGVSGQLIYVYEVIGSNSAAATITFTGNNGSSFETEVVEADQGLTSSAIANRQGVPIYKLKNGESFVVTPSAGTFTGRITYGMRS